MSGITTIRPYTETFASLPKETSPVLVTRVIDNNTIVPPQIILCQPVQKKWQEGKKEKKNKLEWQLQSFLH